MATAAKGSIAIDRDPDVSPTITHDPLTPEEHERDWSAVYDGRGTCRMGTDPRASVVDPMLRVHGIQGLRIVDGSVLPSSTPYLVMPEVVMLAERAVDLILDVATYPVSEIHAGESLREAVQASN